MKLVCEGCGQSSSSLAGYRVHLLTEGHQYSSNKRSVAEVPSNPTSGSSTVTLRVPPFLLWSNEINNRAVVVTEFKNLPLEASDLLNYFATFGFVTDFIYDPEKCYAIVLYDERSSVESLQQTKCNNVLKGRWLRLRSKAQVSSVEWIILIELDAKYGKEDQKFFIEHAEILKSVGPIEQADEQLQRLIDQTSAGLEDVARRQCILREVHYIIRKIFDQGFVYPLQPMVKGLHDLDAVFEIFVSPYVPNQSPTIPHVPDYTSPEIQASILRIFVVLQNQTMEPGREKYCSDIDIVHDDAEQGYRGNKIIRGINFFHIRSGIRCKISFDSIMEANVSSLISFILGLDIRILPLFRILNYWTRIHRFSHRCPEVVPAITMLAVVYLVRKNIIPSVFVLQQLGHSRPTSDLLSQQRPYFVGGWDVSFLKDINQVEAFMMTRGKLPFQEINVSLGTTSLHDHVMTLLSEFFEAFSTAPWNSFVISSFLGELVPRELFVSGQEGSLPSSLHLYKIRSSAMATSRLNSEGPLVIQHPFDLGCNLAQNMDGTFVADLKTAFLETSIQMKKLMSSPNPRIINMFPQIHTLLNRQPVQPVAVEELEIESTNSESGRDSGKSQTIKPSTPTSKPLSYSFIAKKATNLPNPEVAPKRSALISTSSSRSRSTSNTFKDPDTLVTKYMKFEVNKRFKEAFLTTCAGLTSEGRLKDRLKTLAIVFMRDFIWSVWGRCFYLHATAEKIADTEQKFYSINKMFTEQFPTSDLDKSPDTSDTSMSDIPDDDSWQNELPELADVNGEVDAGDEDEWKDLESDEEDVETFPRTDLRHAGSKRERGGATGSSKNSPVKAVNLSETEKVVELKVKLDKIPKSACKNYCQVIRLHGYQKIWSNRRAVRSALILHEKLSKQSLILKESQGTASTILDGDAGSASTLNPFEREESVTRAVLEAVSGWGKTPSKRAIWSFSVVVRIDTSKEIPTLFISMKEGRNPYVCHNMINYFGNVLPSVFSEYMTYRLNKWLDGHGTVAPPPALLSHK